MATTEEGNVGIDEFCDLITQKLLKLPQDQKFIDVKRTLRFALKAEKAEDVKESLNQYIATEGVINKLLEEGSNDSTLKSLMGIVKKRIQFHQKSEKGKNLTLDDSKSIVVNDDEKQEKEEDSDREDSKPRASMRGGKRGRKRGNRGGGRGGIRNSMMNAPITPAFEESSNEDYSNNNSPVRSRSPSDATIPSSGKKKTNIAAVQVDDFQVELICEATLLCIFFPLNNDEMGSPQKLLTLLQNSLSIPQRKFDSYIDSVLQHGNFEYILLQLEYQRNNIEDHPIYSINKFRDDNAYNDWMRKEQNRIQNLEQKIKTTYPGTKVSKAQYTPPASGYNELYKSLSRSLYRYIENGGDGEEDFGQSFIWLLNEFSVRYGIRELFKVIDYICTLVELLGNDSDRLKTIRSQFLLVKKIINNNGETPTTDEEKLLQENYDKLANMCSSKLSNIFSEFVLPNDKDFLLSIIDFSSIFNELSEIVPTPNPDCKDMVKKCLKVSVKNKYGDLKKEAASKINEENKKSELNPALLMNCADLLAKAIDQILKFTPVLQDYLDVKENCCKEIVKLYIRDVEDFSEKETHLYSTASILDLSYRIYQASTAVAKKYEGSSLLVVIDIFPKFVYQYMDEVKKELSSWVKTEIENEDWEEIDEDSYYSLSCSELMHKLFDAAALIRDQTFMDPARDGRKKETFLQMFYNNVFSNAIEEYVKKVFDSFINDFTENKDFQAYLRKTFDISTGKVPDMRSIITSELDKSIEDDSDDKVKKLGAKEAAKVRGEPDILAESCVRINNLVFFYDAFAKVSRSFRDGFKTDFKKLETFVEKSFAIMVMVVIYWMNHKIYLEMNYFVKQKRVDGHKVSNTTDLIVYLDEQIGILSRHLDSGPFDCDFLPGLWRAVVVDMRLILLNVTKNGKKVSGGSTKRANFLLQELRDYFYQGGNGLPGNVLDSDCNAIISEIEKLQKQVQKDKKKDKKDKDKKEKDKDKKLKSSSSKTNLKNSSSSTSLKNSTSSTSLKSSSRGKVK